MKANAAAGVTSDAFRQVCSSYATGITVVTLRTPEGAPQGMTVNSFTSVSLDPPLILVCIDRRATLLPWLVSVPYFAVNILSESQREISTRFAQSRADRFDGVEWRAGEQGSPVIEGTLGCIECRVAQKSEAGDHIIFVGEVLRAQCREGRPLLYFRSRYRGLDQV
jgi:flavin reductase (DIM6/NTAB) family NADH-FMN oxidoreductase RutF